MIKLELTIDEVNLVLGALSKQPYEVVAAVISKISEQGKPQAEAEAAKSAEKPAE